MCNFPAFILRCLARVSFPSRLYYFIIKKQSYFHFDKKRNINYTSAFERQKKKKSKAQRPGGDMPSANGGSLGGAEMMGDPAHPLFGTLVLFTFSAELTLCIIK